jgi:hypothetical protein
MSSMKVATLRNASTSVGSQNIKAICIYVDSEYVGFRKLAFQCLVVFGASLVCYYRDLRRTRSGADSYRLLMSGRNLV